MTDVPLQAMINQAEAALEAQHWPDPVPDFPVQPQYRVAADLSKLQGPQVQCDRAFPVYLREKLVHLRSRPDALLLADDASLSQILPGVWRALGLDRAGWVSALGFALGEDLTSLGMLEEAFPDSSRGIARRQALALSLALQEDWVLVGEQGQFEAGSVCFPSAWAPGEKFGQPLVAIHSPVADGEALRKASGALIKAMSQKGPFQRQVWTLTHSPDLARHPAFDNTRYADTDSIFFRSERQTTLPLRESGRALFLIRIKVWPLEAALGTETRRERLSTLKSALQSMSDEVLDYKNLRHIRQSVLAMK